MTPIDLHLATVSPGRNPFLILMGILFLSVGLSGCATFKGRSTYVKVVTDPPGASVMLGNEVIGHSPLFARVPRARANSLIIRPSDVRTDIKSGAAPETQQTVPLTSAYRWQESFLANFVWLSPIIWPIGWTTDFMTGACWDYEKLGPIRLPAKNGENAPRTPLRLPVRSVAIAPPQSNFELLSDEMAGEIQKLLRAKLSQARVHDYDATSDTFTAFNYTYKNANDPAFDDSLWQDLDVTHFAESKVIRDKDVTRAQVRLHDIFLEKDVGQLEVEVQNSELSTLKASAARELLFRSFSLIPNTLSVQVFSTSKSILDVNDSQGLPYLVETERRESVLDLVSRISLRNLPHPKSMRGFRGRFRITPDFSYSNQSVRVTPPALLPETTTDFRFQTLSAGFGPELGLQTPAGYLYLQLVPVYAMHFIRSTAQNQIQRTQKSQIQLNAEFGFLFFATDEINVRIYGVTRNQATEPWNDALKAVGLSGRAKSIVTTETGIAIGYYFPGIKRILRRSLF